MSFKLRVELGDVYAPVNGYMGKDTAKVSSSYIGWED